MKFSTCFYTIFILSSFNLYLQAAPAPRPTDTKFYTELTYETVNGKMFIYGELGGKKRKFLFDTGAPSQISKELFNELKTPITSKAAIGDAYRNRDSVIITTLPEIRLNNIPFNQVQALVMYPDFYKCWNIDGVIGSNLLKGTLLQINSDKHLLIFTNDESKLSLIKDHGIAMAVKGMQLDPELSIYVGKKVSAKFHFDTGDSDFINMTEDYMRQLSKYKVFEIISTGYGSNGIGVFGKQQQDTMYRLKIASVKIAGAEFKNVIVETNKSGIPRIGSKILDYGIVTLDYIHNKFYFDAKTPVTNLEEKRWPVSPFIKENQWIVFSKWQEAGNDINVGDQILTIDDMPLPPANLCDRLNGKPLLDGRDKAVLKVKNAQGNIQTVEITKK